MHGDAPPRALQPQYRLGQGRRAGTAQCSAFPSVQFHTMFRVRAEVFRGSPGHSALGLTSRPRTGGFGSVQDQASRTETCREQRQHQTQHVLHGVVLGLLHGSFQGVYLLINLRKDVSGGGGGGT